MDDYLCMEQDGSRPGGKSTLDDLYQTEELVDSGPQPENDKIGAGEPPNPKAGMPPHNENGEVHTMKQAVISYLVLLVSIILPASTIRAEEGMWRPRQLPSLADKLRALNPEVDPSALSELTGHPMNAVIWLGGCTASFVSAQGLVITNHHCAYGSIQHNSTEDNNLLENGFLAGSRSQELPAAPGSRVLVTVAVEDVTPVVLAAVPEGATGRERYQVIEDQQKALIAECEKDPGHRCRVASYSGGLEYELIKQFEIRDIRLVYAPALAIGKYGGDVDNWMWPRHTGDYAFYRAYLGPDGKPADYSEDNLPYRPKHYLKVSTQGVETGDLVMVAGYPGRTNRYRLAREVGGVIGWDYPQRSQAFQEWLDIMEKAVAGKKERAIKVSALQASLRNVVKNYQGMLEGFAKSDILERKRSLEQDLQGWIETGPERRSGLQTAAGDLGKLVAQAQSRREGALYYDLLGRRSSLLGAARRLYRLSRESQKPDEKREPGYQERDLDRIRQRLERIERTYDPEVDRACWRQFILNYAKLPPEQHVQAFDDWFGIQGSDLPEAKLDERLDEMYGKTRLGELKTRVSWMKSAPQDFHKSEDPFIRMAVSLYDSDMELEESGKELQGRFDQVRPRFMEALIAYNQSRGKSVYPDANATLRVTYGTVKGYSSKDGIRYLPFTTLRGIAEKYTGEKPFDAPVRQLELIRKRDFGSYYVKRLDSVPVNFLSTLDVTGGNSGSPTLNARGELVGLLFDGNWESIIADWDFIPAITRAIQVDIRYVLWTMERLDGAQALLTEMGVESVAPAR